jgi:hypothetical protein
VSLLQQELFTTVDSVRVPGEAAHDLFREVSSFPSFATISNGELFSLSLSNKAANLTHGLHRFAGKYIPRIPAWVLDEFAGANDIVLDPFCGSGTTLVEALSRSKLSIGIDCDPLACLISTAKTSPVRHARIQELGHILRKTWHSPAQELHAPMLGLVNFAHWFSETAWGYLQSLRAAIMQLDCAKGERDFLLCVFSSVIRYVSNADDQTQKTYVSGTLRKRPPEVGPTFWRAFGKALIGLRELEQTRLPKAHAKVIQGDASNIELAPASVDLVITSPPYLDSVDYMYNFMLEYFWLGPHLGVPDRPTFNKMRRSPTGAKNPLSKSFGHLPSSLDGLIDEADILATRISATRAYCASMAKHFRSAADVMKPNSYYILVIGNSQTGKGVLPIHDSLIRLAADAGLSFQKAFAYRIRRHYMKFPRGGRGGIITMDWIIVLKNTQGRIHYPSRLPLPSFTLRADEVAN